MRGPTLLRLTAILAALTVGILPSIARAQSPSACSAKAARFGTAYLNSHRSQVKGNAKSASLIFVGTVKARGGSPFFWSGIVVSRQTVHYTNVRTLKGHAGGKTVSVDHLVVAGSHTANTSAVGLSRTLFRSGARVIVFAVKVNGTWQDFSENYGTFPYSAKNEAAVKALLGHC